MLSKFRISTDHLVCITRRKRKNGAKNYLVPANAILFTRNLSFRLTSASVDVIFYSHNKSFTPVHKNESLVPMNKMARSEGCDLTRALNSDIAIGFYLPL